MIRRLLGALQFLTVFPISGNQATPGKSAIFFPLTGALLGASAGMLLLALHCGVGALLTIAWLLLATGCLHEDGLADVADAIRAGRSRERMLAILKDSRIGTYGALALIVTILLRWQALSQLAVSPIYGLVAALALSRTGLVVLAAITPSASDGLGRTFASEISRPVLGAVILQGVAFSMLPGWVHGMAMLLSSGAIVLLARAWFMKRLGGVNGDCIGATCQVVETANLVILTWRHSI